MQNKSVRKLNIIFNHNLPPPAKVFLRSGHILRGKPPGVARSLEQRLQDDLDLELSHKVNIGFPKLIGKRSLQLKERIAHVRLQRKNAELEKAARTRTLSINLEDAKKDYFQTCGQFHLRRIADHFGIYNDLFGNAYFVPRVPLSIKYTSEDGQNNLVHCGNVIKPFAAQSPPKVEFDGTVDLLKVQGRKTDNYWSIVLTNPDGHFSGQDREYIHWFISNIPGSDVGQGEEIVPYIQPFPPKGLGYQRFIFILYKQEGKLDMSKYKISQSCELEERTFSTLDFYRANQEKITPAGLAFFQSIWDKTLTDFYHNTLGMKEPIYEYDFVAPYIAEQKWFPLKQPFNLYMDKYRDPKKVLKEYLERKLAKTHPFEGPEPSLRFPNAHPIDRSTPSWLVTKIKKDRLKIGRINDL